MQQTDEERRAYSDRRNRPTEALGRYSWRGQRRAARREAETLRGYYVDHPGRATATAALSLLLLGVLDGLFTLRLIEAGATEANPVMDFFLSHGVTAFLTVKYGITVLAIAILVIHKNFPVAHPRLRVKWVLLGFLSTYGGLISYEVTLLGLVAG